MPKGVVATVGRHFEVARAQVDRMALSPELWLCSCRSLDASLWEVVMALSTGATLGSDFERRSEVALRSATLCSPVG